MPSVKVSTEAEHMPNSIDFDPPGSLPHFMNSQQLIFPMFLLLSYALKYDPSKYYWNILATRCTPMKM
jgi:hypothetical protein